jgi:ABC-type glutathione transport system ATPase component
VGESGSGKSTLARVIAGLKAPDEGEVFLAGTRLTPSRTPAQRRAIQMVFQDPDSSLNPRMTVRHMLAEVFRFHRLATRRDLGRRLIEVLEQVRLDASALDRYPSEFSGGQRQRLVIARALAVRPSVLVADEPTSALDSSVQLTVLDLLRTLQRDLSLTMVFISHDLGVINAVSDTVAVMHDGRLVEVAPRDRFFADPRDPYSRELLAAVPRLPE